MLAYAGTIHRLTSGSVHTVGNAGDAAAADPSAVYQSLLKTLPFDGIGDRGVTLEPQTGDRASVLWLQNVVVGFNASGIFPDAEAANCTAKKPNCTQPPGAWQLSHVATFDMRRQQHTNDVTGAVYGAGTSSTCITQRSWLDFTGLSSVVFPGSTRDVPLDGAPAQTLQIGNLCIHTDMTTGSAFDREVCDYTHAAVAAINDKNDGFFDDLLPDTHIEVQAARCGCSESPSLVPAAMQELEAVLPDINTVVGLECSNDIEALYRHYNGTSPSAMMSADSRAPQLANDLLYPNLARFMPNDNVHMQGVIELFMSYSWKRIAILADDSTWGQGTMLSFRKQLNQRCHDCIIPNEGHTSFSLEAFRKGSLTVASLVKHLHKTDSRIIILITQLDVQRDIYVEVFRSKLLYGKGYAWYSAWMTDRCFYNDDGTINADAVRGAEGLLGYVL